MKYETKLIEAVDTDTIVTGLTLGGAVRGIKINSLQNLYKKKMKVKLLKKNLFAWQQVQINQQLLKVMQ